MQDLENDGPTHMAAKWKTTTQACSGILPGVREKEPTVF